VTPSDLLASVRAYYSRRIHEHGPTARGVDWNSAESQTSRFDQLLRLCEPSVPFRLGDYGCGYGALYDYVRQRKYDCTYQGFDIAEAMLEVAGQRYAGDGRAVFGTSPSVLEGSDYVVASGVFNVKLATPRPEWEAYVFQTLDQLADLARCGFGFNALTSYSDPERMRPDLYYADPCLLFDRCKRRYSRQVALLHDYGLYEFTILVRK
jgi:SAM-dependent methyltransferase